MTVKNNKKTNNYVYKDYDLNIKQEKKVAEPTKEKEEKKIPFSRLLRDGFVMVPRLNVRSGPSFSFNIIKIVNQGERLFVSGETENDKGELWYQITMDISPDDVVAKEGTIGYVKANFIEIR